MGKKLTGMLNLSKIPRDLIGKTKKGESCIFIDIVENRDGADEYGNTHYIRLYDKANKKPIYLGNLKPMEFGEKSENSRPASSEEGADDLPF